MGLLDQLAGQVADSLGGQQQNGSQQPDLLSGVMGLINNAGGLQAILQQLQASGLGDQVASWIGTGQNHAVSGSQISDALGADSVAQIAQQAGLAPEQASAGLAQLLPQIIDQLTPDGHVPQNELLAQGLNLLKGKLFS